MLASCRRPCQRRHSELLNNYSWRGGWDVITLVAAALVLHRIHDHNRAHERCEGCSRSRRQAGELLLGRAVQLPPVHASDAEPGLNLFPAHPLVRRRQIPVSVAVDAS